MRYNTDLTDAQWNIIEPLFCMEKRGRHFQKHTKRELINAVLYVNKVNCQWRLLPNDMPPWGAVWSFYRRCKESGLWDKIMDALAEK